MPISPRTRETLYRLRLSETETIEVSMPTLTEMLSDDEITMSQYNDAMTHEVGLVSFHIPIHGNFSVISKELKEIQALNKRYKKCLNVCLSCKEIATPDNATEFIYPIGENAEQVLWCLSCWYQHTFLCDCGKEFMTFLGTQLGGKIIDSRHGGLTKVYVCNDCYKSCVQCEHCERSYKPKQAEWKNRINGICYVCVNQILTNSHLPLRNWKNFTPTGVAGKTVTSFRKFGIELEVQYHNHQNAAMGYLHTPTIMGFGTDGSIRGAGVELRSPPMNGLSAENIIYETCKALKSNGYTVDNSCGFHVHVDTSDIASMTRSGAVQSVKDLWLFHMAFEDVLISFLSPSRRPDSGQAKRYCKSLRSEYHMQEIINASDMLDLETIWYRAEDVEEIENFKGDGHHDTRYRGVNLHSLFANGHIEIRSHTGTIMPRKILEWVNLHTKIVDTVFAKGFDYVWIKDICNSTDISYKTQSMFDYLGLTPQSREYFEARQEMFYVAPQFKKSEGVSQGKKLLQDEKES